MKLKFVIIKTIKGMILINMKKFFNKLFAKKLKDRGETGQVQSKGRFDKLLSTKGRSFSLANRLEHIKKRGKQNNKKG